MSFISLYFLLFLIVVFGIYFLTPIKARWCVLLVASIAFYSFQGLSGFSYMGITWILAYLSALIIQKIYDMDGNAKERARRVLVPAMLIILFLLVVSKTGSKIGAALLALTHKNLDFMILIPLGISYYTFGVIGYMLDVFWKKDRAEKNPFRLLLYMIYFPQIVEGPIPRHKKLAKSLLCEQRFDYERFCFGLQRMLWGFFKKLIIADRAMVIVKHVFADINAYEGIVLLVAILASAIQMYSDFSGCMDIALGISECFGITLEENFKRPFFSTDAATFWHRWHITLGNWFKDYVCMPVTVMKPIKKFSKWVRKKWGGQAGRNATTIPALIVVWICTGAWHGAGYGYLLWGVYWGSILIFSTLFETKLKQLNKKLHINEDAGWFKRFQMVRTFLIFCGGRLITTPSKISDIPVVLYRMIKTFNPWVLCDGTMYNLGLERLDFWVCILGIILLYMISKRQEQGIRIRQTVSKWPLVIRWLVYITVLFIVLIFGYYGEGFDASSFIYMKY